eukprot:1147887-Pelagomonas_calceolata.AAC.2
MSSLGRGTAWEEQVDTYMPASVQLLVASNYNVLDCFRTFIAFQKALCANRDNSPCVADAQLCEIFVAGVRDAGMHPSQFEAREDLSGNTRDNAGMLASTSDSDDDAWLSPSASASTSSVDGNLNAIASGVKAG